MVIILMGVTGVGKSTIGRLLADELGWDFYEGDDYHSRANLAKLRAGDPLTDIDRAPWLLRLRRLIEECLAQERPAVLTCSALKDAYRAQLRIDPARVRFIHLTGSYDLVRQRLQGRTDHFMAPSLLRSQLQDLETPTDVPQIPISGPPAQVVAQIRAQLELPDTTTAGATRVLADGLMFPEAPRWHAGYLWFTDQHARKVQRMTPQGRLETLADTPDLPGGLGWLPDGSLLVVAMTQRLLWRMPAPGVLEEYARLAHLASFHCNDMVVDRQGRAYVGNFGYDIDAGAPQRPAELLCVRAPDDVEVAARDLIFPNGTVISADEGTLIVAETFAGRLSAFSRDGDGRLSQHRSWAELGTATPDGICLDQAGAVWVASPSTHEVLRVHEGGRVSRRVRPHGAPYACMLGGPQGRTLYILSAATHDPQEARRLRSGRIEALEVDVAGAGLP